MLAKSAVSDCEGEPVISYINVVKSTFLVCTPGLPAHRCQSPPYWQPGASATALQHLSLKRRRLVTLLLDVNSVVAVD